MSEIEDSRQHDAVVVEPPVVGEKPRARLDPRFIRLGGLAFLLSVGGTWLSVHLGVDWYAYPLIGLLAGLVVALYKLITRETDRDAHLVPWIREQVDRMNARVLGVLAIPIFAVILTVCTIEIRDLAEGTRITVPSLYNGETSETAVKGEPVRLHFFLPFRLITIGSDRHAKTTLRAWPVWPRRVHEVHLTRSKPPAGVLLRLPLPAQRYLGVGEFAIEQRHRTNESSGAILIGDYPLSVYQAADKKWPFPPQVDKAAQDNATAVWNQPVTVTSAPGVPSFRVAYVVNGKEVAAAEGVQVPPAGLTTDVEMKWTYGKPKP
jgi:hypothetical protein